MQSNGIDYSLVWIDSRVRGLFAARRDGGRERERERERERA